MIEKGKDWGRPGSLGDTDPLFASDRELAVHLARATGRSLIAAVTGGDLARTLGIRAGRDLRRAEHLVAVDAITVSVDGRPDHIGVAHVVAGHFLRDRYSVAIMNAAFIGDRNIAPRAHPGDGRLDVVTFELSLTDRIKAARRMPTGTHVPHPGIGQRRVSRGELAFERPLPIRIDGHDLGRARTLTFEVLPAAIELAL